MGHLARIYTMKAMFERLWDSLRVADQLVCFVTTVLCFQDSTTKIFERVLYATIITYVYAYVCSHARNESCVLASRAPLHKGKITADLKEMSKTAVKFRDSYSETGPRWQVEIKGESLDGS